MAKLISGRVVVQTPLEVAADPDKLQRYEFLGLNQAEPNLDVPPDDGNQYFLFRYSV